jgi:O-antigen/teichoic acid export membrane protein
MLLPLILVQLGGMGVPAAVTYVVARAGSVRALPRRVVALAVAQALAILFANAAIFAVLVADDEPTVRAAAVVTLPAAPAWLLSQYGLAVLQGEGRFPAFNLLRNLPALLYALVTVVLVALDADSLVAFALLWSLTWPASALATGMVVRRIPGRPAAREGLGGIVNFGLRALPGVASPFETFRLDQAVVGLLLSPYDLGLYVVAVAFTVLPRLLALSVGAVAYPRVAATRDATEARRLAREAVLVTGYLCLAVFVPLFATAPYLIELLFGEEYVGAATVMRILLVGAVLIAVRKIVGDVARGLGKPGAGSLGELASWVAAVPLVALLLPLYGLEGVALALTAAAGLSLIVVLMALRGSSD